MRIASVGHVVFAVTLIGLGVLGFVKADYVSMWAPLPKSMPALAYVCDVISLATGIGLLWKRSAAAAARVLLVFLWLWFLLVRVPGIFHAPSVETWWPACQIAVMTAAAWVIYVWFGSDWDKRQFAFASGHTGLRCARIVYGVALIPWGISHLLYIKATASLVPHWLPWHVAWAYITGCAFIVAGLAIAIGVLARVAAALSALQIGLFTLLVWVPIVAAGSKDTYQWSETVLSAALTAAAWVVADSYRNGPHLKAKSQELNS